MADALKHVITQQLLSVFKNSYDAKVQEELEKLVDAELGKMLSSNDLDDETKARLASAIQSITVKDNDITVKADNNVEIDLSAYVKNSDLANSYKYKGSVESFVNLPTENQSVGDVYNIVNADSENNIDAGDNVVWNGTAWDNLSGILDLSNYVRKEDGKGLSTNDLTDELLEKINNIQSDSNANVIEKISVDDTLLEVADKKVNIDLSGKVDKAEGSRLFTDTEGTRLEGVETLAQKNVVEVINLNGIPVTITDKTANLDLSGYMSKEEGKDFTSNDFTDEDKAILDNFEFATEDEVLALFGENKVFPYVEFISQNKQPFQLRVNNGGDVAINPWDGKMFYSIDKENWIEWNSLTTGYNYTPISSSADGRLYIRGKGNTTVSFRNNYIRTWLIAAQENDHIEINGNIENFLDYEKVASNEHPKMSERCFYSMFGINKNVGYGGDVKAETIISNLELPATELTKYCYAGMFENTSTTKMPKLPAKTLQTSCYSRMLYGCSIEEFQNIPATNLAENWCADMIAVGANLNATIHMPASVKDSPYAPNNINNVAIVYDLSDEWTYPKR